MINGYASCLREGVVSLQDKDAVLEFLGNFRVIGPELMKGYIQARNERNAPAYLAELNNYSGKVLGSSPLSEDERQRPYYREILTHVFQNNAGGWGSIDKARFCQDRTEDLAKFSVAPSYVINTLDAGRISLREGADQAVIDSEVGQLKTELTTLAQQSPEELRIGLVEQIDSLIISLPTELVPPDLETIEQKLAVLYALQSSGEVAVNTADLEEVAWKFSLLHFGDHQQVINSLESRSAQSPNPAYSFLTEYHQLVFDRRKEALRLAIGAAAGTENLQEYFRQRFAAGRESQQLANRADTINRMQGKFGISPAFITQIGERLYGKEKLAAYRSEMGDQAVTDWLTRLINRYETVTGKFQGEKTSSDKTRTKQVYGMLRSRRQATEKVLGEFVETEAAHDIPLTKVDSDFMVELANEAANDQAVYSPGRYFNHLGQLAMRIGNERLSRTEAMLGDLQSETGIGAKRLVGYFTKTKESALARMVGGVCVSQDNPRESGQQPNMWEKPNYLQLVLQDPDTLRCQGLVLLHHFTEPDGKKILTASFNPAQGYLQNSDEASVYLGLQEVVTNFAAANNFDAVGVSTNGIIRTNRTGGVFERTMNEQIAAAGQEEYRFAAPRQFSNSPAYFMDEINLIWKKPDTAPES